MATLFAGISLCVAAWRLISAGRTRLATPLLVAVAVLLLTPRVGGVVGAVLHRLTGIWNLEDQLAHDLLLIACGIWCAHIAGRLGPSAGRSFQLRVQAPLSMSIPVLLTLFSLSHIGDTPYRDLFEAVEGPYATSYWVVLALMTAWLLIYGMLAATLLYERPILYMVATGTGLVACLVQLVIALGDHWPSAIVWASLSVAVIAFSVAVTGHPTERVITPKS